MRPTARLLTATLLAVTVAACSGQAVDAPPTTTEDTETTAGAVEAQPEHDEPTAAEPAPDLGDLTVSFGEVPPELDGVFALPPDLTDLTVVRHSSGQEVVTSATLTTDRDGAMAAVRDGLDDADWDLVEERAGAHDDPGLEPTYVTVFATRAQQELIVTVFGPQETGPQLLTVTLHTLPDA